MGSRQDEPSAEAGAVGVQRGGRAPAAKDRDCVRRYPTHALRTRLVRPSRHFFCPGLDRWPPHSFLTPTSLLQVADRAFAWVHQGAVRSLRRWVVACAGRRNAVCNRAAQPRLMVRRLAAAFNQSPTLGTGVRPQNPFAPRRSTREQRAPIEHLGRSTRAFSCCAGSRGCTTEQPRATPSRACPNSMWGSYMATNQHK